jgi:hypothetical protein
VDAADQREGAVSERLLLEMFVLDSMQDDIEDLESVMRYLVEWRPLWPHDFTEEEVLDALKSLTEDGLVGAYDESPSSAELKPVECPNTDPASLRRYWFRPTTLGRRIWKAWDAPSLPEDDEAV